MATMGIDIGGTGIKGAPVDLAAGRLTTKRKRILTPQPATPAAVAEVVAEIVSAFPEVGGPVGCTFPAVVRNGVTMTAANVDESWIGCDADALFTERLGREVHLLNDADAAGIAEDAFGAGRDVDGVVLLITLGTGVGTALLTGGKLVPNTELGHIELDGVDAELQVSERARIEAGRSWEEHAPYLDRYLEAMERLINPDLIVLGGGGSKEADVFLPLLRRSTPVVPATLGNTAGIVGAAMAVRAAEGGEG